MDNTMYVSLSRQMVLQRELDIVANNIANTDTNGFKVESLTSIDDPVTPTKPTGSKTAIQYTLDGSVARDFTQGGLQTTNGQLDVAIDGKGFFQVTTADGTRYTRDGRFTTDPQGQLTTQKGDPVLDASGSPITINATNGPVTIGRDGTITQTAPGQAQSSVVGRIGVVRFDNLSDLSKAGDGLYVNTTNQTAQPAPDVKLQQGMLEASNVQPVVQITDLIRIQRAYEAVSQMISNTSDLSKSAIQRLGTVQ